MRASVFIAALLLVGCTKTIRFTDAPAVLQLPGEPSKVEVLLTPDPEYGQGRFGRTLRVVDGGRVMLQEALQQRWARAVRMNVYADESVAGRFIISECEWSDTVYALDRKPFRFEGLRSGLPAGARLRFVGAFDEDARSRWRFIPSSERGELPLPAPER